MTKNVDFPAYYHQTMCDSYALVAEQKPFFPADMDERFGGNIDRLQYFALWWLHKGWKRFAPALQLTPALIQMANQSVQNFSGFQLSRFMWYLWHQREDLQQKFPLSHPGEGQKFIAWYYVHGLNELKLTSLLSEKEQQFLGAPSTHSSADLAIPLSNLIHLLWNLRADLQKIASLKTHQEKTWLIRWFYIQGVQELNLAFLLDQQTIACLNQAIPGQDSPLAAAPQTSSTAPPALSYLMYLFWSHSAALQKRFDLNNPQSRQSYAAWYQQKGLKYRFIAPELPKEQASHLVAARGNKAQKSLDAGVKSNSSESHLLPTTKNKIYFLHIHKSVGSSFVQLAISNRMQMHNPHKNGNPYNQNGEIIRFWKWPEQKQRQFLTQNHWNFVANEAVLGEHMPLDEQLAYVTILRDPLDRIVSQFYHQRNNREGLFQKQAPSLVEFIMSEAFNQLKWTDNFLIRCFNIGPEKTITDKEFTIALQRIKKFKLVLFQDSLNEGLEALSQFGWKNWDMEKNRRGTQRQSNARSELQQHPQALAKLIERNTFDIEFYRRVKAWQQQV